jgi:hypothetical protein
LQQNPICNPLLPHSCYMPLPSHPPRLDHSNYTWRRVQIMKLLVMQFSPFSRHLISLRSKCSPRRPALKHPPRFHTTKEHNLNATETPFRFHEFKMFLHSTTSITWSLKHPPFKTVIKTSAASQGTQQ